MSCVACGADLDAPGAASIWKDGLELRRCGSCGLLARRTLPTERELADLYSSDYFQDDAGVTGGYADYLADEPLHRELARRRLSRLPTPRDGARLLDVGAAAGFFVSEAQERGWEAQGVDISPAMVDHATRALGVPVMLGQLADVRGGTFDAITMWDYIEHSVDPAADLTRSAALLQPGGVIALSTGDIDSIVARLAGKRWHLLTPRHHNFFFSEATLRLMLERSGFDVVAVSHAGARYSLSHLVYKLGRHAPSRLSTQIARRAAQSRVGRASIPVNLRDIVSAVAVRRAP